MKLPINIDLPNIGTVTIAEVEQSDIKEASAVIYTTYQHEGIWLSYTEKQITEDISSAFTNQPAYRPVYFIAKLDRKIIGIAGFSESFMSSDGFELSFATILPEYQKKGLGKVLLILRIKTILGKNPGSVLFTRTRIPKLFESFNFQYIYKTFDTDGVTGPFDYMFCKGSDVTLPNLNLELE